MSAQAVEPAAPSHVVVPAEPAPEAARYPPGALLSTIALIWNYVFNGLFEAWEARQASRERTLSRRILHGLGFEGGLVFLLVPVMAWGLDISMWAAFLADLGLLVFFFVYAIAFTWAFDTLFGPPASATEPR